VSGEVNTNTSPPTVLPAKPTGPDRSADMLTNNEYESPVPPRPAADTNNGTTTTTNTSHHRPRPTADATCETLGRSAPDRVSIFRPRMPILHHIAVLCLFPDLVYRGPVTQPNPPFVSVVLPVYNDRGRISDCLECLLNQTYPASRYEIIVVDNGSTDGTGEIVRGYPVTCVEELEVQSSYVARNRGLAYVRGEIIAFIDSDCVPSASWIEQGVRVLFDTDAALAGGAVRFTFSAKPTGAELYDSVTNMQIERNIRERGVAKTANLFVRAKVFETVGPFPEAVSGGDVTWTSRSTRSGFKLVYAEGAEVRHPARRLGELVRKQYRVGRGQPAIWSSDNGTSSRMLVANLVFAFAPRSPGTLRRLLLDRGLHPSPVQLIRAWLAGYSARLATGAGQIHALVVSRRPRQ
jgi:glycosyltransferase AglE